jgi:hypothetical protein
MGTELLDNPEAISQELIEREPLVPIVIGEEPVAGDLQEIETARPTPQGVTGVQAALFFRSTTRKGTRFWREYEFEGDGEVLLYRPTSQVGGDYEVELRQSTFVITVDLYGPDAIAPRAEAAFEKRSWQIAQMVGFLNADIARFNDSIPKVVEDEVRSRCAELVRQRELRQAMGYPLTKVPNPPRPIPIQRRILGPKRRQLVTTAAAPTTPDWLLDEADYEDVIEIMLGMSRAFERTPHVAAAMEEEHLRDIFLVVLNGTYQGAASGETFVGRGKTDILVTMEDRHVFVGECKKWDGESKFAGAIDQLFGYLPWRNVKAALIVFIEQQNATLIIDRAERAIRDHDCYVHDGATASDPMARRNYVLHHRDDPAREVQLALIPVVIRPPER